MQIVMYVTAADLEKLLAGEEVEACGQKAFPDWYELRVDPSEFITKRQSGALKKTWFTIKRK